jgi:hypothetical protein
MKTRKHVFYFKPDDKMGEAVSLTTEFTVNQFGAVSLVQQLHMESFGKSACITCANHFTPEILRQLACELEKVIDELKQEC